MSRQKLRVVVGLIAGHTTLRAHIFKLELTRRQGCRVCAGEIEGSVHNVCHCPALACKRYKTLGCKFSKPKNLETRRVYGLISLVSNTRLGVIT